MFIRVQPPYVGVKCCEPGCGALETSGRWWKSKRAETLGEPLCNKCDRRYDRELKKALKVGGAGLLYQNPFFTAPMVSALETRTS
jgi:hypothetical protein